MRPDIEEILTTYLKADAATASITQRIVGKTPTATDTPWVRMTRLDAGDGGVPDHLIDFLVQFDCYAGKSNDRGEVDQLAATVRAALKRAKYSSHDGAVITKATIVGDARVPDDELKPARERVILTATVWAHGA